MRFSQGAPILPSNHEIGNGGQNTTGESKIFFFAAGRASNQCSLGFGLTVARDLMSLNLCVCILQSKPVSVNR